MRQLKCGCSGQKLQKDRDCDFAGIVRGSKGYLQMYFDFDADWKDKIRVAEFRKRGKTDIYPCRIENGLCMVRDEVTDSAAFCVRVVGKSGSQYIRTNEITIRQEG